MSDAPIQLIVAAFRDEGGASAALDALKQIKKEKLIAIKDAAVLRSDAQGKLHINEIGDMTGTRGGVTGAVVGAALGILTGGAALAAAGIAAVAGGLAAKLRDSGFNDQRLKRLGAALTPGSSAIVAVVEHTWVTELESELQKLGADVLTEVIAADKPANLRAPEEAGHLSVASEDGAAAEWGR